MICQEQENEKCKNTRHTVNLTQSREIICQAYAKDKQYKKYTKYKKYKKYTKYKSIHVKQNTRHTHKSIQATQETHDIHIKYIHVKPITHHADSTP